MTDIEYLKKYLDSDKLEDGLERLKNGEPVQYIVGNVDFYGYELDINKSVLIPRFETEELVSRTINYIKKYLNKKVDILDIGTGSGCISIVLKDKVDSNVDAVDISNDALEVAKSNSKKYNLDINFIQSDVFSNVNKKYDVIISNPPYIDINEEIMDLVYNNEPHLALFADNNGLYFYEKIIKESSNYLNDKFIMAFEIGYMQGNDIVNIAKEYYSDAIILLEQDLSNKDRYIFIIKA